MEFIKAKKIFDQLYNSIDGYGISLAARKKLSYYDKSLTYGEINFDSFYQILNKTSPKKEKVFYDLGSGTGKAVMAAHLLFNFKKAIGIEILEDLYKTSISLKNYYEEKIAPFLNEEKKRGEIDFIHSDFLKADFLDGDIFFINSTCFYESLMLNLERKLLNLKKGTAIITLTNKLHSECFNLIDSELYKQNWGEATVNFYIKN